MGFLYPSFLAGLLALGLPIWLHLLRHQTARQRVFSTTMFFSQEPQPWVRRRRLQHLLLLALRLAFLTLLVLAFAQPYLSNWAAARQADQLVVIAIDNSFSMRAGGRLAEAKKQATALINDLGAGQRVQVLSFTNRVKALGEPTTDKNQLLALVNSVEPTDELTSFAELASALQTIASTEQRPVEAHIFSDFQETGMPGSYRDLLIDPNVQVTLHRLLTEPQPNYAVESVEAPARIFGDQPLTVKVTVRAYEAPAANLKTLLLLNGEPVEQRQVHVPQGDRAVVEFKVNRLRHGLNHLEVQLEAQDPLPEDNRYRLGVEHADPRPVLLVHEVEDKRSPVYIKAALEASTNHGFDLQQQLSTNFSGQNLNRYKLVIFSDVSSISNQALDRLTNYVSEGGSLFIVLGPNSKALQSVPVTGWPIHLEAGTLAPPVVGMELSEPGHPLFNNLTGWHQVRFYQVNLVEPAAEAHVLARVSGEYPLLIEQPVGKGKVIVLTSALDNLSNDWPLTPNFVVFMARLASYLADTLQLPAAVPVGTSISLRSNYREAMAVEVLNQDGQSLFSLAEASSATSFIVPAEGYFRVRRNGREDQWFAANADRRESVLVPAPQELLAMWENTEQPRENEAAVATTRQFQPLSFGWPLLLLAAIVGCTEILLASRYLQGLKEAR